MASKRTSKSPSSTSKPPLDRAALPTSVARALDAARAKRRSPVRFTSGQALALVPVVVLLVLVALIFPRQVPPTDIPLPRIDMRALAESDERERALAERARRDGLGDELRLLGSAVRNFNVLQARDAPEAEIVAARSSLNQAVAAALEGPGLVGIALLRAVQCEAFLGEVLAFERTGTESAELVALGGGFVRRMTDVGWRVENRILPGRSVRRVLFSMMWNSVLGLLPDKALSPTKDDLRALYAFYIEHPHAPESRRSSFEQARAAATSGEACEAARLAEAAAAEEWRFDKLKRLGAIDDSYPLAFALGVANYRLGRYGASAEAFRDWLREHPDGALTLRAQNHLKAAIKSDGAL